MSSRNAPTKDIVIVSKPHTPASPARGKLIKKYAEYGNEAARGGNLIARRAELKLNY